MKLTDLKLPKRNKETITKEMPTIGEGPRYPYGTKLDLNEDVIDKMPRLEKMKIGEKVSISGVGEVVSIRMNEDKDRKKRYSVEIQIQKIGISSKEDFDESFKEATE